MATVTDIAKLKDKLKDLDLEERDIERQVRSGVISENEWQEKRNHIAIKRSEIELQEREIIGATQETHESKDGHDNGGYNKPLISNQTGKEKKIVDSSSEKPIRAESATQQENPLPTLVSQEQVFSKRAALKEIGKTAANKTGSIYKYTPLGFLVGQIGIGQKEREFAKTIAESILSAPKTLTKASTSAARTGAITALKYTPGGLLWEHLIPEKIKANLNAALRTNFIKNPPIKIDIKRPVKTGGKKGINVYSKLYKYTPLGLVWENYLPKSTRDFLKTLAKSPNILVKKTSRALTNKSNNTTPALIANADVKEEKTNSSLRNSGYYQRLWNKNIITSAIKGGYNRFELLQKIRNAKIWKSSAWKYGKYAVSPLGAALYDKNQYVKKHESDSTSNQTNLYKVLKGQNPYAEWTSPKSLSNKFLNTAWNKSGSINKSLGRAIGNKAGRKTASKIGQQLGKKAAQTIAQTGIRTLLLNPVTLTVIGIIVAIIFAIIFLVILISAITGSEKNTSGGEEAQPPSQSIIKPIPGFALSLTGPTQTDACQNPESPDCFIEYTISYAYTSSEIPLESITIYDVLPSNTTFISATGDYHTNETTISWPLDRVNNQTTLTLKLKPSANDILVVNKVFAKTTYSASGNLQNILPPSTESSPEVDSAQQQIAAQIAASLPLIESYKAAENITGIPWQILAGLHYREGNLNPNTSLVSGRPIGENEPDIERGGGCSTDYLVGEPVALPNGGCGFKTFTDSVIYAAKHFKAKNGGSAPSSFQELSKALSYYNGGGNANCGKTPYTNCPAQFIGDDDTYVMNLFDKSHTPMYVVYCADFTLCNPPSRDQRLGVASAIMGLNRFFSNTQQ